MDALFALQATDGPRTHETQFGARWVWNGQEFPCTHDEIMQNPPLIDGGFSPNTSVTVSVRSALLPGLLPKKGDYCYLLINATETFSLQVQTVFTNSGDQTMDFLCMDANQNAWL